MQGGGECYCVECTVEKAGTERVECIIHLTDSHHLWHGLYTITDYKIIHTTALNVAKCLLCHFEANSPSSGLLAIGSNKLLIRGDDITAGLGVTISAHAMCRALKRDTMASSLFVRDECEL